jgi:hypothetical protein
VGGCSPFNRPQLRAQATAHCGGSLYVGGGGVVGEGEKYLTIYHKNVNYEQYLFPSYTMQVPDILKKDGSTEAPKTLGEGAANATGHVSAVTGKFGDKLQKTLEAKDALTDLEIRTRQILQEGMRYLTDASAFLQREFGVEQSELDGRIAPVRESRDASLYQDDFKKVASFYRTFLELKTRSG